MFRITMTPDFASLRQLLFLLNATSFECALSLLRLRYGMLITLVHLNGGLAAAPLRWHQKNNEKLATIQSKR